MIIIIVATKDSVSEELLKLFIRRALIDWLINLISKSSNNIGHLIFQIRGNRNSDANNVV